MTKRKRVSQIYEAVRKINDAYEYWALAHGLTLYEMQVYYVILEKDSPFITQKELCDTLDAPKTSINSIIKKQLKTGYIEMTVNPVNKREKMIVLTDAGKKYVDELITPLFRFEEEIVSQFSDNDIEAVINTQGKFAELLMQKVRNKNV